MNTVERLDEIRGLSDGDFWFLASPYRRYSLGREAAYQFALDVSDILEMEGIHHWSPIVNSHVAARKATLNPTDNKLWYSVNMRFFGLSHGLLILAMPGWDKSDGIQDEHDWFTRNKRPIWLLPPALVMPSEVLAL